MHEEIIKCIHHCLLSGESLAIPNLGVLAKHNQNAGLDYAANVIEPPGQRLIFETPPLSDDTLVSTLAARAKVSVKEAQLHVQDFVGQIRNELENKGNSNIDGIGIFYAKSDGDIHFIPAKKNFDSQSFGLPVIDLTPVASAPKSRNEKPLRPERKQLVEQPITPKRKLPERKRKRMAYVPLFIAAFICLGLLAHFAMSIQEDPSYQLVPVSQFRLNKKPEKMPAPDSELPQEQPTTKEEIQEASEPIAPVASNQDHCLVIAGAFGERSNADRLKARLIDLGYDAVSVANGSLTRIGISTSCQPDQLNELLATVQVSVEPGAWILNTN